jgi:hypothetical protein
LIPGELGTYIYDTEEDFYRSYQGSYYARTWKKAGWDCLRHYEILASGAIPYFRDLDKCEEKTLALFPKELVLAAMNMPGVSAEGIDHRVFDQTRYREIVTQLLDYTRKHLTTRQMAKYVLETIHYAGEGKILFLSGNTAPDYLRCLMLIGFKELLGERVVDYPKIKHIYRSYPDTDHLHGKGFTYTRIVDDLPVDRGNIAERIRSKEFDLVIYGSIHRNLPYHDLVKQVYHPDQIVYFCGEDAHHCAYFHTHNLFLREFTPS